MSLCIKDHGGSLCFLGQIFLEFVLCALFCVWQVFQEADHIMLKQSETFCPADGNFVLLNFLKLVNSLANVHPTSCARVFNDGIRLVFLRSYFVNWLAVTFENFTCILGSLSSSKHGSMGADGDISNWEKIVF